MVIRQSRCAGWMVSLALAALLAVGLYARLGLPTAWAQSAPLELTKVDVLKLKTIDSSQWAVLGVRLGDSKEAALQALQRVGNVKVQDDPAAGRIFVIAPPSGNAAIMSVKVTQNVVTTINMLNEFSERLQGDTRFLFRAFEDDSLRYKLLGREDQREAISGGTKEAPAAEFTYAYFKEGILLHYSVKRSSDGKQAETLREMVLVYPPKSR